MAALAVLLLLIASAARAQQALVLSGGAARGIAHAGVVLGLEQRGYDPTLVVGTSMGAIVGALYAAGYTPLEIWHAIETIDWTRLFTAAPVLVGPERAARLPLLRLRLGAADYADAAVLADWRINRELVRLLFDAAARARGDFDRLPRRFRAVAADLATGKAVVLGAGDLARAVRASMAVPGGFAPVVWGDRILVDGGLANNLPITVARELGGQLVIASDVVLPPPAIRENSALEIGLRGFWLLLHNAMPGAQADLLVLPDVPVGVGETAFLADARPLLRLGWRAALRDLPPANVVAPAEHTLAPAPSRLDALEIEANDARVAPLVRAVFGPALGEPYDAERVLAGVDRLYATGLFAGVWPAVAERDTITVLRVHADATSVARLTAAAGYDNDRSGRAWAALQTRVGARAPIELAAVLSTNGLERLASASVVVRPPRFVPLAWTAGAHRRESDVRRFEGRDLVGEREVRRTGGWVGVELTGISPEWLALSGLGIERIDIEDGDDGRSLGPLLRFARIEPLPSVVGTPALVELEARFGALEYQRAHVRGSLATILGRTHIAAVGDLAVTRGGSPPPDARPALGDERLMPGLRWGEGRDGSRIVTGIDVAHPIPHEGFARVRARVGAGAPELRDLDARAAWVTGIEGGVSWRTPLGIVEASVGAASTGQRKGYVSIGTDF